MSKSLPRGKHAQSISTDRQGFHWSRRLRFVETNLTLIRPSPKSFVFNLPDSGRHVPKPNQGLSTGRRENLGTRLLIWLSHPRSREIWPRTNAVSSCRITVSGDRRYFGHGSRKCSSDMRRSLLNVCCGVAMIEVCLWSKKSAIRWVFGPHPPLNRQGPDRRLFFSIMKRVTGVKQ